WCRTPASTAWRRPRPPSPSTCPARPSSSGSTSTSRRWAPSSSRRPPPPAGPWSSRWSRPGSPSSSTAGPPSPCRSSSPPPGADRILELGGVLRAAGGGSRLLADGLAPVEVDGGGLEQAVEQHLQVALDPLVRTYGAVGLE